jgi:uncharacterized protein (DUF58 family)
VGLWLGLVLTGVVAFLLPVPVGAVAGLALWAVAGVSWRWSVGVRRGIELTWQGPARLQPDEAAVGTLTVRNRSRWPVPWLEVQLRLPAGALEPHAVTFVVALGARRERRLTVDLVAGARGVHTPRELTWRAGDPLGLVTPAGTGSWTGVTVVVPRLAPVRRLDLPSRSPLADLPQPRSLFVDQTALVGVRAYERGDPLSAIHWPATAHTGALMRREHARAAARELLVCLDLDAGRYQRRGRRAVGEAAIATAASLLADTMLARRQQAGLAVAVEGAPRPQVWPVRSGDRHLHAMLDLLARVRVHDGHASSDVLRHAMPGLHGGTTVVLVTGEVDDAVPGAVAAARRAGLAVRVLSLGSGVEWASRVPRTVAGAPCVPVEAERALERLPL